MSIDPTGPPFPRTGTARTRTSAQTAGETAEGFGDVTLKAESILLEEFESAGVAAYQARDNMAGLLNLYMVAAAALATGAGVLANAYNPGNKLTVTLAQVLLLAVGALLSGAFFARLLDLGHDYRESLIAMNLIKEFYIERLSPQLPELATAFYRRLADVRRSRATGRGNYAIGASIAALGSIAAAAAVGEARQLLAIATNTSAAYVPEVSLFGIALPYAWELLAALVVLLAHVVYYRAQARSRGVKARMAELQQA
jgi:hypothetical protein